jgi:hypothetical protein
MFLVLGLGVVIWIAIHYDISQRIPPGAKGRSRALLILWLVPGSFIFFSMIFPNPKANDAFGASPLGDDHGSHGGDTGHGAGDCDAGDGGDCGGD